MTPLPPTARADGPLSIDALAQLDGAYHPRELSPGFWQAVKYRAITIGRSDGGVWLKPAPATWATEAECVAECDRLNAVAVPVIARCRLPMNREPILFLVPTAI